MVKYGEYSLDAWSMLNLKVINSVVSFFFGLLLHPTISVQKRHI